ncbi:MAG TPA: AraC family ligand binding domain-containing protein, partial [Anaerolineae bacterium]
MPATTHILETFHNVTPQFWSRVAHTVIRAGRVATAKDYRIQRDNYPGQDLLYCLCGAGKVETLGRQFAIGANQLVWIANEAPHVHEPAPEKPWELLWCRIDGPDPPVVRRRLFGTGPPVVTFSAAAGPLAWFDRLFQTLRRRDIQCDMQLNLLVAELLVLLERSGADQANTALPAPLLTAREAMRAQPELPWHTTDVASLTDLSPSHIRRLFRQYLGMSPRQWLIH